ncbi:MAG TPA: TonB-dependent receptor, partial [Chitinophagales bacterium]|nr:TonB-dependent receptor [Chitinophagales bacterium]
ETFEEKGFRLATQHRANTLFNFSNGLRLQTANARWKTSLALFDERNQNLFWFRNTAQPGAPVTAHEHAESNGHGASFGTRYAPGKNALHAGGFVYRVDRALPPTMLQSENRDTQDDANAAAFLRFEHNSKTNVTADVTAALHRIAFFEGATGTTFVSNSAIVKSSVTAQRPLSFVDATIHAQSQLALADVSPDVYNRSEWQHGLQLKLSKLIKPLRLLVSAEAMQRVRDEVFVPFNYSLSVSHYLNNALRIEATHARLTRLPGLNDRFWIPGGHPLLEPELALRNNAKVELTTGQNGFRILMTCDAYYDRVDNWIQWVPAGTVWSPRNVKTVLLYGVTPNVSLQRERLNHVSSVNVRYNYNRAVTERSFAANDASIGKQLMYVPEQTVHAHASHGYRKWSAFGAFNYTGTRFTATDHAQRLDGYATFDAGLSRRFDVKSFALSASVLVENATDTVYQSVAWKPMPPRGFSLTLTLQYHSIPNS